MILISECCLLRVPAGPWLSLMAFSQFDFAQIKWLPERDLIFSQWA
jgi:hypothetical protein